MIFMPETKNKTLEEIDELFEKPTREIVAMNLKGMTQSWGNVLRRRNAASASDGELDVEQKQQKETMA